MTYIDGTIIPVAAGRREDYLRMAREMAEVFLEHGAIRVVENLGDDVPEGKQTDLWRAVGAEKASGETIAFSWIVWPSKEARNAGWAACMADERMKPAPDRPFDGTRMIFGGFEQALDIGRD